MLPTVHTSDLSTEESEWDSVPVPDLPYGCTFPEVVTMGSHIHVLGHYADEPENEKKVISMDMRSPVRDPATGRVVFFLVFLISSVCLLS